jgi:hypothetical protein
MVEIEFIQIRTEKEVTNGFQNFHTNKKSANDHEETKFSAASYALAKWNSWSS